MLELSQTALQRCTAVQSKGMDEKHVCWFDTNEPTRRARVRTHAHTKREREREREREKHTRASGQRRALSRDDARDFERRSASAVFLEHFDREEAPRPSFD